jgi:hypothetical protein
MLTILLPIMYWTITTTAQSPSVGFCPKLWKKMAAIYQHILAASPRNHEKTDQLFNATAQDGVHVRAHAEREGDHDCSPKDSGDPNGPHDSFRHRNGSIGRFFADMHGSIETTSD